MIQQERNEDKSVSDRTARILGLANRVDWLLAAVCLGWAAYQSSLVWAIVGTTFLVTAWVNPVARMRKAMARSLVKRA